MITQQQADHFAETWIGAWNRHDLDAILQLYRDDVVFTSPIAARLLERDNGTVHGSRALRRYYEKGLERYPDLNLELIHTLPGVSSLTLVYRSINNLLAAEVFELDGTQRISRVLAHYKPL